MALVVALTTAGVPSNLAAQADPGGLRGTAYSSDLQPLPNTKVQVRNIQTGDSVASTMSGPAGEFSFSFLPAASYVIELVDSMGRLVGMSAPFTLASGAAATVSVVMVGTGAAETAVSNNKAGFSLFGLGPTATLAVLGAAGAAGVTAVVATRQDASPSR
jgi:hypothetical protein